MGVVWESSSFSRDLGASILLARAGIIPLPTHSSGIVNPDILEHLMRDPDCLSLPNSMPKPVLAIGRGLIPIADVVVVSGSEEGANAAGDSGSGTTTVITADIDDKSDLLEAVLYAAIPCLKPSDIAGLGVTAAGDGEAFLTFGPIRIVPSQVFARSAYCRAFTNIKPVLPGHVLVSPARAAPALADLTAAECADLFETSRRIGNAVMAAYGAKSMQLSVQDGREAGQSVPHVHVHVIPRLPGDLAVGDDIYGMIEAASSSVNAAINAGASSDSAGLTAARAEIMAASTRSSAASAAATHHSRLDDGRPSLRGLEEMAAEARWYESVLAKAS